MTAASEHEVRRRAWWALFVLTLTYVLSFVDRQILSLLVEPLRRDLGITDFQVSLLQGLAFAVIYALAGLPLGGLADRFSRRNIIVAGVLVWSAMTASCGLTRQYWTLFIGRAGVGIGEAALSPSAYSMLTDHYPPRHLPRAMSIYNLGPSIGAGLSYLLGGAVLALVARDAWVSLGFMGEVRPWQLTFLAVGSLGLPVALLLLSVREPQRRRLSSTADEAGFLACWRYLRQWRSSVGALFLGMAALGTGSYATMAWYPTMFVRNFAMELSEVGLTFGGIYVVSSIVGNLIGGWGATWCADRGLQQPYVRWMLGVALLLTVASVVTPLLPTANSRFAASAFLIATQAMWMGAGVAATHLVAPMRMRAQLTAILLFGTNVFGLVLGPSGVAALTEWFFGDLAALNRSLALVSGAASVLGLLCLLRSRRGFEVSGPHA